MTKATDKPGAWVDLGLTLPVFLVYHLGVVFLQVKNASDVVTGLLLSVTEGNRAMYVLVTLAVGVVFAGVFAWLGRGHALEPYKFAQVAAEGVVYATGMRFAGAWVVAHALPGASLAPLASGAKPQLGGFVGFIMSLGAGFYEELAFRVLLFGLGAKLLVWVFAKQRLALVSGSAWGLSLKAFVAALAWAFAAAAIFSGVHYVGPMRDDFDLRSFVFRWVLGLALTLVYATRGFAAAVWTHALYDVWVLVL